MENSENLSSDDCLVAKEKLCALLWVKGNAFLQFGVIINWAGIKLKDVSHVAKYLCVCNVEMGAKWLAEKEV